MSTSPDDETIGYLRRVFGRRLLPNSRKNLQLAAELAESPVATYVILKVPAKDTDPLDVYVSTLPVAPFVPQPRTEY